MNVKGYVSASQGVVLLYKYFGKAQSLDKGPESYLGLIQDPLKPMGLFLLVSMGSGWILLCCYYQPACEWKVDAEFPAPFGEAAEEEGEHCL